MLMLLWMSWALVCKARVSSLYWLPVVSSMAEVRITNKSTLIGIVFIFSWYCFVVLQAWLSIVLSRIIEGNWLATLVGAAAVPWLAGSLGKLEDISGPGSNPIRVSWVTGGGGNHMAAPLCLSLWMSWNEFPMTWSSRSSPIHGSIVQYQSTYSYYTSEELNSMNQLSWSQLHQFGIFSNVSLELTIWYNSWLSHGLPVTIVRGAYVWCWPEFERVSLAENGHIHPHDGCSATTSILKGIQVHHQWWVDIIGAIIAGYYLRWWWQLLTWIIWSWKEWPTQAGRHQILGSWNRWTTNGLMCGVHWHEIGRIRRCHVYRTGNSGGTFTMIVVIDIWDPPTFSSLSPSLLFHTLWDMITNDKGISLEI